MTLAFIGTVVPDTTEFHTPAFNRAGQMFQEELLRGMTGVDCSPSAIFSLELLPSFPRSRRLIGRCDTATLASGHKVRLLPFVNVQPLKPLTVGISLLVALLSWAWRHRVQRRVIHVINLTMPPGIFAWMAARLTGSHIVVSVLDVWKPGALVPDTWQWRLDFAMQRWLLPRLDGHSVVSQSIADDFLPGRRVCLLEGGVAPDRLASLSIDRSRQDDGVFRIILAGSLEPYNGFELAAEAMGLLPGAYELVVAGVGTLSTVAAECARRDPRIVVVGQLSFNDVVALYGSGDLLLNLRLTVAMDTRYFFPSKLMELLASGVPVLSTSTGQVRSEYGHVTYLLEDETPRGLATALGQIRALPAEHRATRGAAARAFMLREKTWDRQAVRLVDYIHHVVLETTRT